VRGRKALVLGLAIMLVLASLVVVACGGDDEAAKATLRTALDKVEKDFADLTTSLTSGGTVADLKGAKVGFAADWQAVVDAAGKVPGADVTAATDAWTKVDTAISALPDTATLQEAGMSVLGPVMALQTVEKALRLLVGETPSS
jgi:hypothetical protein